MLRALKTTSVLLGLLAIPIVGHAQSQPMGAFTPDPDNHNVGPQQAKGLIVWSHGYMTGRDSTSNATQPYVKNWTSNGYDGYRFDREYIHDPTTDANKIVQAVQAARALGYKRIILAGQSTGAWESIIAASKGAQMDAVIAVSPAWHGKLSPTNDGSRAKSEWATYVRAIRPGARYFVVKFLKDDYDPGGMLEATKTVFDRDGVDALLLNYPAGFSGHGAGNTQSFNSKFGRCLFGYIETGVKAPPCIGL
jgi:pimeloyl-ACP methyl ester carboxylesterase